MSVSAFLIFASTIVIYSSAVDELIWSLREKFSFLYFIYWKVKYFSKNINILFWLIHLIFNWLLVLYFLNPDNSLMHKKFRVSRHFAFSILMHAAVSMTAHFYLKNLYDVLVVEISLFLSLLREVFPLNWILP